MKVDGLGAFSQHPLQSVYLYRWLKPQCWLKTPNTSTFIMICLLQRCINCIYFKAVYLISGWQLHIHSSHSQVQNREAHWQWWWWRHCSVPIARCGGESMCKAGWHREGWGPSCHCHSYEDGGMCINQSSAYVVQQCFTSSIGK